ncbi:hypothetical protein J6590_037408 [Homalodisca vitripennis]|nr:hypothetical protein J6590_037408 [Homalodisca vitripennis]
MTGYFGWVRLGAGAVSDSSQAISLRKKDKPALNQPLQSKQEGVGTFLCLGWQEPLTLREQTPPTRTVISRSRLDLSNDPYTVMCCSWISIRLRIKLPLRPRISTFAVSDVPLLDNHEDARFKNDIVNSFCGSFRYNPHGPLLTVEYLSFPGVFFALSAGKSINSDPGPDCQNLLTSDDVSNVALFISTIDLVLYLITPLIQFDKILKLGSQRLDIEITYSVIVSGHGDYNTVTGQFVAPKLHSKTSLSFCNTNNTSLPTAT